MERILEQLDKKKCKFDGCNFERNSQALVTEHEETCAHKTFKCKWSAQGCNFEATKALIGEHEDNCEHSLSQQLEAELSIAGAAKLEKPKKDKRNRKAEAPATLMPDGLCWKHHKYGDRAHKCDLPSRCIWDNDTILPSTPISPFEHRGTNVCDADQTLCKFHGCSYRNKNPRNVKKHEKTVCPLRNLSIKDYRDAAVKGDTDIIMNMIAYGRDKNPADLDHNGWTPLHWAADFGHVEIAQLIMSHVDEKNPADRDASTPLHAAAQNGHIKVVQLIMLCVHKKNPANKYGRTPLYWAAREGHAEVVQHILQNVEDKNPTNKDGQTPMHAAAFMGHVKVVKLILQTVEDKSPTDKHGNTPLHWAAGNGHVEVVKFIIQNVDNKNPADKDGLTPLHAAAFNGHVEIVKLFMQNVVEKNPAAKNGKTPLHLAAQDGHVEVVQKIFDCVENRHPRDIHGKTPLQYAIAGKQLSVVQLFRPKNL